MSGLYMSWRTYTPLTTIMAKIQQNSYLTTGKQITLKDSKPALNVLQVFQRKTEKLAKIQSKNYRKKTGFTECLQCISIFKSFRFIFFPLALASFIALFSSLITCQRYVILSSCTASYTSFCT